MIYRGTLTAGVLLVLGLVGTTPASAQAITSPYDFVEGSQTFYGFGSAVFTDRGTLDTGPGSGYAAGAGYQLRISGPFVLDIRATYLPTDRRVYTDTSTPEDTLALRADPMFGLEQIGTADLSLMLLDASLRFNVTGPRTWHRIQPYFAIGVGGALVAASDNSVEAQLPDDRELRVRFQNGFTGHVGAGFELFLTDRLAMRADARNLFWKLEIPRDFLATGRVIDDQQWVQSVHLGLGLSFRL